MEESRIVQSSMNLWGNGVALVCNLEGELLSEELHGLFAGDTRVLSTYQLMVSGYSWVPLGCSRSGHGTAQWEFQNRKVRDAIGEIAAGTLLLTLRRRVDGAMHDDVSLQNFAQRAIMIQLTLQVDADFADISEAKSQSLPPRVNIQRRASNKRVELSYEKEGFRRGIRISFVPSSGHPVFVGSQIAFQLELAAGGEWKCCVEARPEVDGRLYQFSGDPHQAEPDLQPEGDNTLSLEADPLLLRPFLQGRADLHALAVACISEQEQKEPSYVAAGVPWFFTLFGRDPLITALLAGLDGAWTARETLAALGERQATERDDWRDAEPGKLLHEMRRGELAIRNRIPSFPAYYGTHDAPALYCLALWNAWRWTGDHNLLEAHLETAKAAMRWCEQLGDRDGDGLLEYATRSSRGYTNQSWKDAGDAVVHADGSIAEVPLATIELQGYLFAAQLALAELLLEQGDHAGAERLRKQASRLREHVEALYWLGEEGFYAFALDSKKHKVDSIASNPGHLLWCGLPDPQRAAAVARRLLQPDLFSGWGLRTLSSKNPAYNPLSYQRGSIWPHDTVLAAAGLWRYGLYEQACKLIQATLEAANAFEEAQLPELFCGLPRSHGLPVPYEKANRPQAWAAASLILIPQLFLGLLPDAARNRCFVSPWLPEWLPRLSLKGIAIGAGSLDITIARNGDGTVIEHQQSKEITVIEAKQEAPLWGKPPG